MSLRARLALLYITQLTLVLGIALGFVYVVHSDSHENEVDSLLARASKDLAYRDDAGELLFTLSPQLAADWHLTRFGAFLLDTASGTVLATTGADHGPAFSGRVRELPAGYRSIRISDDHLRVLVTPFGGENRYLVASASLVGMDVAMDRLRGQIAIISLGAIVVGFGLALIVAARALRPVDQVSEAALSIANTRSFDRRVPVPRQRDKLGRLVRAFNLMLDALEEAHIQQRRFVSDVSHELRTPLTTIQGCTELAITTDVTSADRSEALRHARDEAARLSRLVDHLLDLARADEGSEPMLQSTVELDALLMDVFVGLRQRAAGRLVVSTIDPAVVRGNADRLTQLLLIPLDNALRYTPEPGKVYVSLQRDGACALVTVEDEGIGVTKESAGRAFERFYRDDAARRLEPGGSGLGLPIARWIAERHGGSIELTPRALHGTTVHIRLPLVPEAPTLRTVDHAEAVMSAAPLGSRR